MASAPAIQRLSAAVRRPVQWPFCADRPFSAPAGLEASAQSVAGPARESAPPLLRFDVSLSRIVALLLRFDVSLLRIVAPLLRFDVSLLRIAVPFLQIVVRRLPFGVFLLRFGVPFIRIFLFPLLFGLRY